MKIIPIPTGTKDIMPSQATELRLLEKSIRRIFCSFGYGEVKTPTLEMETSLEAAGEKRLKNSFRFFDERGDMLVLRPEMTIPIARLVATRMADKEPPLRLCYFAQSFRPTEPQRGRQSEFSQAGLELVGVDSPEVDAEVVAIMCEALEACGLRNFSVGLGEASFFRALLENAGVDEEEREGIFEALLAKDIVSLTAAVNDLEISAEDRDAIMEVTTLRGNSEVLNRAQELVRGPRMDEALKRLARTFYLITRYGYGKRILFDFGIFRNFEYYTGLVFEVLSEDIGFPIGGGGRYNGLLEKFGMPAPAVGFALGLDRLHIAVTSQGGIELAPPRALVFAGGLDIKLDLASKMRQEGIAVLGLPEDASEESASRIATENDLNYVVLMEGDKFILIDTVSGEKSSLYEYELMEALTGKQ